MPTMHGSGNGGRFQEPRNTRNSVYKFVTCAMFLILFINKTLTRQTGYELAYGKVYELSIRLRVFQVMASACALT